MADPNTLCDQGSVVTADGRIWVGDASDPMDGPVVLENDPVAVNVERTDVDEVAIHATLPGDDNAVVSIYVSRIAAVGLAKLLEMKAAR